MNRKLLTVFIITLFAYCGGNRINADASGTFEAEEVIVSAELSGQLLSFVAEEGRALELGAIAGTIDAKNVALQKEQITATISALSARTTDLEPQVKLLANQLLVQESQYAALEKERERTANLLKKDAATGKQLDDIIAQLDVLQKQMAVTRQQINVQKSSIGTQNRGILSESGPLEKRVDQLDEQLEKASIRNPVAGTVLSKYVEQGEFVAVGKPLYKVASLDTLTLRAYITGAQLPTVAIGQPVTVLTDSADGYRRHRGTITWVSDKAEFTPKTIQTKEERANLVYAIKVRVKNDGLLKIGMYGEILLNEKR